jgi:Transposase DDE domain group 1
VGVFLASAAPLAKASGCPPNRVNPRHPGELYPRVGFIVTNLARPAERIVAFYNHRGTAEQWIKEGKGAIKWTRLSCRSFAANAVRLQLHALAYNLGNFMRTLAMPKAAEPWSLTSLRDKLIKIGAKVVSHSRYVTFQMAEVAVPQGCSRISCRRSPDCGRRPRRHDRGSGRMRISLRPASVRTEDRAQQPGVSGGCRIRDLCHD